MKAPALGWQLASAFVLSLLVLIGLIDWLQNVHIPEYNQGTWNNHAPRRMRKLLLHRSEIQKLIGKSKESGLTLIPLELYFKDGKAKIELGLARGKKDYDKRQTLLERTMKREAERDISAARRRARSIAWPRIVIAGRRPIPSCAGCA